MRALFRLPRGLTRFFSQNASVSEDFIKKVISSEKLIKRDGKASPEPNLITEKPEKHTIQVRKETEVRDGSILEDPTSEQDGQSKKRKISRSQNINFEQIKVESAENHLIASHYGTLRIPDAFKISTLTNIYYLVNTSNINFICGALRKDKISLLLFPPVILPY